MHTLTVSCIIINKKRIKNDKVRFASVLKPVSLEKLIITQKINISIHLSKKWSLQILKSHLTPNLQIE